MDSKWEMTKKKSSPMVLVAQFTLRVLAIAITSAAMITMLTSNQRLVFGQQARYSYAPALKFALIADAVLCAYSVLSLILVFLLARPKSNPENYFALFFLDLVMALLMMAGCAAATAIGFVSRYGMKPSWFPVCHIAGKFCNKVTLSVAFSYVALIFYVVLTILSVSQTRKHCETIVICQAAKHEDSEEIRSRPSSSCSS